MNSLSWRVFSAIIAVAVLAATAYFLKERGVIALGSAAVLIALNEFRKIGFQRIQTPVSFQFVFMTLSILIFIVVVFRSAVFDFMTLTASLSLFFAIGLWLVPKDYPNVKLLTSFAMGTLGFIYCVAFPALAIKLLTLSSGREWFFALLLIVFAGDTFAFFGGRAFGKRKLRPSISPKKTLAGSVSGLFGSTVLGTIYVVYFFPEISPYWAALFCLLTGFVAQCGDLVISLIKRVAEVKDSGKIMPGHGGLLDRFDGVYIAAPLAYCFAVLSPHL